MAMGYGLEIPAYQVSGLKKPWGIRGYGLREVRLYRESEKITASAFSARSDAVARVLFFFLNLIRMLECISDEPKHCHARA
jgi:hypothetical protein